MVTRHFKNLKPWLRRTITIFIFLFIILIVSVTWIYIDIKSTDITDIQERLDAREQGDISDSKEVDSDSLPSSTEGHLKKAEEFADKPIEMEDALDVTSILLNSGLSIKEMQYLMGQARMNLTSEEKKNVREILLAKLTQEEIDALRQIARYYGRTLDILDPNVKIKGLEEESTELSQNTEDPMDQEALVTGVQSIEGQIGYQEDAITEEQTEENQQELVPNLIPVTQEVEQKYLTQIEPLQNTCEAKVNDLAAEIRADIDKKTANGEQVTVQYLQNTFLQKFVLAEDECDTQFEDLMIQAEQEFATEGFNPEIIDQWRQTYRNVKDETSNKILNNLISKIQNSGN
ncbi:hypothetical protein VQL36_01725 [Chengkuizengella sp. SCS-71B]|uniref:hypothetical protein n=1 Tax=Chengkuizengella sp. SCS-71B TaxID=3115290 RepID=UPI0032C23126